MCVVSYADSMGVLKLRKNAVIILWWVGVECGWVWVGVECGCVWVRQPSYKINSRIHNVHTHTHSHTHSHTHHGHTMLCCYDMIPTRVVAGG